jgi:hypothetical protein
MLIFYYKFSVGWQLMWLTLFLIKKFNMGSAKVLWPTVLGLFSVVFRQTGLTEGVDLTWSK